MKVYQLRDRYGEFEPVIIPIYTNFCIFINLSQKERDFKNTNYNDIKRVYFIWVCMNTDENSISYISC